jgi:hypothetical protein
MGCQSIFVSIHFNIPGQYITNIPAWSQVDLLR